MKLRTKLKLSFCIMVIVPVLLCSVAIFSIFKLQAANIYESYDVDSQEVIGSLFSPVMLMGKITDRMYNEIKSVSEEDPDQFSNQEYLDEMANRLNDCLSSLIVRKNGEIIYTSSEFTVEQLQQILPSFAQQDNKSDVGTYKGGDYESLIKQIDFKNGAGDEYSVSIVTSLEQALPQVKVFLIQTLVSIIVILIGISLLLNLWLYQSIIKPLNRLRLATHNIKMGNLDFEMPKGPNDEIGNVCKDFEEMRLILKKSSEDKINSDREEKELIRNISHDLKTPLTAIKGYVEGILDGIATTPQKQEKYLRTIANKANDMDKLIDELTIYSRLDTNRIPYSFQKINVKDYFDDCCDEIKIDLDAQDIVLNYRYHGTDDVLIVADAEQLKRVVNNIVSNSVKYMQEGRSGVIGIDVYDEGEYIHVQMTDNGKGIALRELPHIFERFYRTDSSRNSKQGGSGIGLAIVKKIIEDHKGKIWAESVEGEGTTMHLNLVKYQENGRYCIEDKKQNTQKRTRWL